MTSQGFEPVSRADARYLILGTLPGAVSIKKGEYYAQRGNAFWRIMERLIGVSHELPYASRKLRVIENGIALWDVCASAHRLGSLDAAIRSSTCVENDFQSFFSIHTRVGLICFNGAKAEDLYCDKVLPRLAPDLREIPRKRLPSTSSAHARMSFDQKALRWSTVLGEKR